MLAFSDISATNSTVNMTETSADFTAPGLFTNYSAPDVTNSAPDVTNYTDPDIVDIADYTIADIVGASGCAAEADVVDCVERVVGGDISAAVSTLKGCTTAGAQKMWAGIADCIATKGDSSCCSSNSYITLKTEWDWATCSFPACAAVGDEHTIYLIVTITGKGSDFETVKNDFVDQIAELAQVNSDWVQITDVTETKDGMVRIDVEIKTPSADVEADVEGKLTLDAIKDSMDDIGLTVRSTSVLDMDGAVSLMPSMALALFAVASASFAVF